MEEHCKNKEEERDDGGVDEDGLEKPECDTEEQRDPTLWSSVRPNQLDRSCSS